MELLKQLERLLLLCSADNNKPVGLFKQLERPLLLSSEDNKKPSELLLSAPGGLYPQGDNVKGVV